jgi:hypothetical protein
MPIEIASLPGILQSGLLAYYKFDSGALTTDSSGNGKTLTADNSPADIAMDFGNGGDLGTANTNKRFRIAASTLGLNLITDWSFVYRFKMRAEIASGVWEIMHIDDPTGKAKLYVQYQYNSGTRKIVVNQDRWVITGISIVNHTVTLGTASEHTLAFTKKGGVIRVYLDNTWVGTAASGDLSTIGDTNPGDNVYLGSDASANYSSIAIDEAAFWSRGLERSEVHALHDGVESVATVVVDAATYISAQGATTNYRQSHAFLTVGEWNGGTQQDRGIIKMPNLASLLPADATITAVNLRIYDEAVNYSSNDRTMRVYRIKRTVNPDQVTWNVYSSGNSWSTAGAGNTTNDREATDIGSLSFPATEVNQYYTIPLDATKIQEFYSGVFTGNALLLQFDTENNDMHQFSDELDTNPPYLQITYSLPGGGGGAFLLNFV